MSDQEKLSTAGGFMPNGVPPNYQPGLYYPPNYPVQQMVPFQQPYQPNFPGQQVAQFPQGFGNPMMQIPDPQNSYNANFVMKNNRHDHIDFKNRTIDMQINKGVIMANVTDGDGFHKDFQGALEHVFSKDAPKSYKMTTNHK